MKESAVMEELVLVSPSCLKERKYNRINNKKNLFKGTRAKLGHPKLWRKEQGRCVSPAFSAAFCPRTFGNSHHRAAWRNRKQLLVAGKALVLEIKN